VRDFTVYPGAGEISDNLEVSIRHAITKGVGGAIAYTWGRTKNSTNGAFSYPNKPFKSGIQQEWANGTDDQRHTLTAMGQYAWRYGLSLSGLYHFGSPSTTRILCNIRVPGQSAQNAASNSGE